MFSKIAIEKTQVYPAYHRQAISYTAGNFEALNPSTRCKADKDSERFLSLTTFGKLIVNLLPSIRFVTEDREYFLSQDISSLPLEFVERLGELQENKINTWRK